MPRRLAHQEGAAFFGSMAHRRAKSVVMNEAFSRFGAEEWDAMRERYREPASPAMIKKAG